ncbi:hypothetical protein EYC84_011327 [Monilinia fructicola]|uniref:SPT23/MGA2-like DNA-binding domain-containing protein n=1 Tax=Monilinia fructicola TaxID=38448 RepID=A0A5M9J7Z7_MONFR|nr:hypothetical protein EYC84_011327 [Monilinia fructicola]
MTLFPVPQGVTKLHLPTQTISKPKLLVKPPPERSPDTLERFTQCWFVLVQWKIPDILRKALERAAAPEVSSSQSSDSGSDEEDDRKPFEWRKKVKKVEEEESWHKDEARRVIVFNTHEVKDWQSPTSQPPSEATGDRPEPIIPEGAMQVDAPMRIACYCRHQNEKIWLSGQVPGAPDGQMFSGSTPYSNERNFDMAPGAVPGVPPFHVSPSAADLQNLPQKIVSTAITPRHPSPQASPSTPSGPPLSKKRKASSSKVPTGLAMTKLETGQPGTTIGPSVPVSATSTITSPFTPNIQNFPQNEQPFCQPAPPMQHIPTHFNTGPPTPEQQ